jgi:hypothetical protein
MKQATGSLIFLAALFSVSVSSAAAAASACDPNATVGMPAVDVEMLESRLEKIDAAFTRGETVHTFFIGWPTTMSEQEKSKIAESVDKADETAEIRAIVEVEQSASKRLSVVRDDFKVWAEKHRLNVNVEKIPENGSFLLFKTDRAGINEVFCAALAGDLPQMLSEPGF